jgi:hypothetical protein
VSNNSFGAFTVIFAFVEDGMLEVHEDLLAVQQAHEGIDVESGTVHFYDAAGTYLEPHFTIPNRKGKTLGILRWVESGMFQLVANPQAEQISFALALSETRSLAPNRWFKSLDQLKVELSAKGVAIEFLPLDRKDT